MTNVRTTSLKGTFLFLTALFMIVLMGGMGSSLGTDYNCSSDLSIVGCWHFNNNSAIGENDSLVVDSSKSSNNATVNGAVWNSTGGFLGDGAFQFNGINSSLTNIIAPILSQNSSATISLWVNPSYGCLNATGGVTTCTNVYLLSKPYGSTQGSRMGAINLDLTTNATNFFIVDANADSISGTKTPTNSIVQNQWNYIVGTFDFATGNITVYINGVKQLNKVNSSISIIGTQTGALTNNFGTELSSGSRQYFNGSIDEVIIFNRSLDNYEVGSLYNNYVNSTTNINTCGAYYSNFTTFNLTSNLNNAATCLILYGNFITLEGNSKIVSYASTSQGNGIILGSSTYYVTINNLNISTNNTEDDGNMAINNSGNFNTFKLLNINVSGNNDGYGIYTKGYGNKIINNTIYTNGNFDSYAITLYHAENISIINNTAHTYTPTSYGLQSFSSNQSFIYGNIFNTTNTMPFFIEGDYLNNFNHTFDSSNKGQSGKSINYSFNLNNLIFDAIDYSNWDEVIFAYGSNLTITNNNFTSGGLLITTVNDSEINTNRFSLSGGTLALRNSRRNSIISNIITTNGSYAVSIELQSDYNNISLNNITNNINPQSRATIGVWSAGYNIIDFNYLYNAGIILEYNSTYSNVTNNVIRSINEFGIEGISTRTSIGYNTNIYIVNNTIIANGTGIRIDNTVNSTFSNNTINIRYTNASLRYYGIDLSESSQNILNNNNVSTLGTGSRGVYVRHGSDYNNFTYNTVSSSSGFSFRNSSNNYVYNISLTSAQTCISYELSPYNNTVDTPTFLSCTTGDFFSETSGDGSFKNTNSMLNNRVNALSTTITFNNYLIQNLSWSRFNLTSGYFSFTNDNLTTVYSTTVNNLTNFLVYNKNGSIYGSTNIASNDGKINITLPPGNSSYVLDNFNLTEGVSRQNSPLWFSSSSNTEKHIASNLSDTINTTVVFNVLTCDTINSLVYTTNTSSYTRTFNRGEFTCTNNIALLDNIPIEPAQNSNEILIYYSAEANAMDDVCSNYALSISSIGQYIPKIMIIMAVILILSILGVTLIVVQGQKINYDLNPETMWIIIGTIFALFFLIILAFAMLFSSSLICNIL